jgi:hypothetical protein
MTASVPAPRPSSSRVAAPAAIAGRQTVHQLSADQVPPAPRFAPGQTVVFVNDYGVNWGEKVIVDHRFDEVRGNVYHITPGDAPWFENNECNLFEPGDPAIAEAVATRPALYRPDGIPWAVRPAAGNRDRDVEDGLQVHRGPRRGAS